jgi:RNA recognition motif-containing protein
LPQESKWLCYSGWEEEPEPPRAMPNRSLVLCLVVWIFLCPILIVNHSVVKVFLLFHAETNEMSKLEYGKSGNTNKDKDADQLSSGSDSGDDMQNSELAGGLEIFVDDLPHDCVKEDIAMAFSQSGEVKSVRIIKNSSTEKNKNVALVCYASIEAAKKVLAEFKEGIEVLNSTTLLQPI